MSCAAAAAPCPTGFKAALDAAVAACATKVVKIEPDAPRLNDNQQLFKGDKVQFLTSNGTVAALAEVMMISSKDFLDPVDRQSGGKVRRSP